MQDWLALMIGNSRLHWGRFRGENWQESFHTPHLATSLSIEGLSALLPLRAHYPGIPLVIASVVPAQTELCRAYPGARTIGLEDIPLEGLYPTLGIDRALAVLGAGARYGFPGLVIDAGTALTLTGVDGNRRFAGGAILPGLRLQFQSLGDRTAALPNLSLPEELPPLWATNTERAIESGILHTIVAGIERFIRDWLQSYPNSSIAVTGGDAPSLDRYLPPIPGVRGGIRRDDLLIFRGMAIVRSA